MTNKQAIHIVSLIQVSICPELPSPDAESSGKEHWSEYPKINVKQTEKSLSNKSVKNVRNNETLAFIE